MAQRDPRTRAPEPQRRRARGEHIDAIRNAFDHAREKQQSAPANTPAGRHPAHGSLEDRRDRERTVHNWLDSERGRQHGTGAKRRELTAVWVGVAFVALLAFLLLAFHLFT